MARARIELCELDPPRAVQTPRTSAGSNWATSEGVRSTATTITGWANPGWPISRALA